MKHREDRDRIIVITTTNNFDGIRMFKYSKENSEVYIWYCTINELDEKEKRTKNENVLILCVLEKKKGSPFKDDLLIPLYSQMFKLSKGVEIEVYGEEKKILKVFFIQFCNDLLINPILLGMTYHNGAFGCGSCFVHGISGKIQS